MGGEGELGIIERRSFGNFGLRGPEMNSLPYTLITDEYPAAQVYNPPYLIVALVQTSYNHRVGEMEDIIENLTQAPISQGWGG